MNNCLVTKLKETVNNDNLDIYGVMKLRVASYVESDYNYFHFYVKDDAEATMTLESDDENEYFTDYNRNKIGKTITAVKNQTGADAINAFRIVAAANRVVTIKDGYHIYKYSFTPFFQYRESLEDDIKWRNLTNITIRNPDLVCNVKKLIKANNNAPFDINFVPSSENVVYDDIKVLAYCYNINETDLDYGNILLKYYAKVTILGKLDIMQIIAVRRYLGHTEGTATFSYPENAYLGDTPLSSFGSFIYIKFAWTESTVTVYTASNDKVYSEVATINNSDKYDWE